MRNVTLCLLLSLAAPAILFAQEPEANEIPVATTGRGPGGWFGVQFHNKYAGLSFGYPLVQRGGRSLGLHFGIGGFTAENSDSPNLDGPKEKVGANLGLCAGGDLFFAVGVETMKQTDAHRVYANYTTSTYDTIRVRTSGYLLLGYRSWPGLGVYVQGGGAIGVGVGVSLQF
jgi:hypothetical protein